MSAQSGFLRSLLCVPYFRAIFSRLPQTDHPQFPKHHFVCGASREYCDYCRGVLGSFSSIMELPSVCVLAHELGVATGPRSPIPHIFDGCDPRQASMSRRLSRWVICANAIIESVPCNEVFGRLHRRHTSQRSDQNSSRVQTLSLAKRECGLSMWRSLRIEMNPKQSSSRHQKNLQETLILQRYLHNHRR